MYLVGLRKNQKHCFHSQILDSDWLILGDEIQQYPSFRTLHNHQKSLQCDLKRSRFALKQVYFFLLIKNVNMFLGVNVGDSHEMLVTCSLDRKSHQHNEKITKMNVAGRNSRWRNQHIICRIFLSPVVIQRLECMKTGKMTSKSAFLKVGQILPFTLITCWPWVVALSIFYILYIILSQKYIKSISI